MLELPLLRWRNLNRAERASVAAFPIAILVWALLPVVPQDPAYHRFADQRAWLGIPRAADVLSNVAFALVGIWGVVRLLAPARRAWSAATEANLWCIALGLLLTSVGSAWYHLDPSDATLAWDRLPMTLVFTGVVGAALAQRVSEALARIALPALFALGVASVAYWHFSDDLSLYATLQLGGFAALLLLIVSTRASGDPFPWWWVIGWYAAAKAMEAADLALWQATGGLVAGHALKHVLAALAGAAALRPLHHDASGRTPAAPSTAGGRS